MTLLHDPLFLTGTALIAIGYGRIGCYVLGAVYIILAIVPLI